jgi:dipeptidyl aminopeptidase/acylaminoacyl peptidase
MSNTRVDIRAYLEIRTATPAGWSPDGSKLLIASDLAGTLQVHRLDTVTAELPITASALAPVTAFDEPVSAFYVPCRDGVHGPNRLLLATDLGGNERYQLFTAPDDPTVPYAGTDALEPLVVDPDYIHRPGRMSRDGRQLAYATNRADGVAFEVWVRDLASGDERAVFATGGSTSAGDFSPDGRYLAVSELTERAGDNRVYLIDLRALGDATAGRTHAAVAELAAHGDSASVGMPTWLPDGSAFYFATDVDREFAGVARGTSDGSWTYVVEPGWDADCTVDAAGRHLLVAWNADGWSRAELRDPRSLMVTANVPLPGDGVASSWHFTDDGRYLAFAYSSPQLPGDVWRLDIGTGALERLTVSPGGVDPDAFVRAELVRFAAFDGLKIPAFVYTPRTGSGPFPVVVMIHGGPESQYRPSFSPLAQYLVARGFAVVAPNVRGSTGYGKRYQHLDDIELRLDAVRDLAALHDWLATRADMDAGRAALYGGSYGGYMVLAGLAFQPERWAAGVDVVGICNLVTFLENTSAWRRAFREREYGSLAHHRAVLEAASPINRVDRMQAPLFIVHGANDPRVPLSEAEQIHRVLSRRGVPCELRVYADEGHGLKKLANRIDCYPRVAAFLQRALVA